MFTQINFVADFLRGKSNFLCGKRKNCRLWDPLWGLGAKNLKAQVLKRICTALVCHCAAFVCCAHYVRLLTVERLCNAWEHRIHLYSMRQFRDLRQFSRTMGKPSIQYMYYGLVALMLYAWQPKAHVALPCIHLFIDTSNDTRLHSICRHAPVYNGPIHWRLTPAFICGSYCNISIKTATARAAS